MGAGGSMYAHAARCVVYSLCLHVLFPCVRLYAFPLYVKYELLGAKVAGLFGMFMSMQRFNVLLDFFECLDKCLFKGCSTHCASEFVVCKNDWPGMGVVCGKITANKS
ncbi:hypothetical protein DUNSADRAFT_13636 [Dunaliella salina]|uniref:Secreted protein n=1 Tax=Dunaliella salina TaxID=3046 RepID=A0ABQ7G924_DUNSA|nr:hypothetical protein DUNSADRAFT_13636 [Dunaliella salina]|eukprot:KAF5831080.1 hypothetical protein DUNSADRAFT_13636 [Dunaliella salina]